MGTARPRRDQRDLTKYETLYQDPDYERIRTLSATREARATRTVVAGGSSLETLGGLTALVTAVVGFVELPFHMAGVATVALGIALVAQGIAVTSRWRDALAAIEGTRARQADLVKGISTETFAGMVGVMLGILALAGVAPLVVLPAAVLAYGGALVIGGAAQPDLVYLAPERNPRFARVTYDAIQSSGSIMVLVGIAAAVLGTLALASLGPVLTLTLVALLSIAASLMFAGGVLTARLLHRAS
jgi:hypothetical protein